MYHSELDTCVRARRIRGLQPLDSGKTIIFRAKANFSGRSQQPKLKKYIFLYLLNEKMEFIRSSKKVLEIRDFY